MLDGMAKWNHVCSEWWLHANCWSGGSKCSPPCFTNILLWENREAEHTGFSLQTFKNSLIYRSTQQMSKLARKHLRDVGQLYVCFLPFLGSWWRSWSGHRRTLRLEPGGRPLAPPLLPCGKPEGSDGLSKAYLTLQMATNIMRANV